MPRTTLPMTLTLTLTTLLAPAWSRSTEPTQDATAMDRIAFLTGDWEGSGWMRRGPGEPHRFTSSESVTIKLAGRVLLIEGLHRDESTGEVVHQALAIVSADDESDGYRFRSYLADGRSGDYTAALEDGRFVWVLDTPGGRARYTIEVEGDLWHEIGEFSPNGETWSQFFQMDLERQSP